VERRSTLAFDLVGDLVYLGEGVAVAVDEVTDLGGGVHDGGVVAAAEPRTQRLVVSHKVPEGSSM